MGINFKKRVIIATSAAAMSLVSTVFRPATALAAPQEQSGPPALAPSPGKPKTVEPVAATTSVKSANLFDLSSAGKPVSDQLADLGIYINGGYVGTSLAQLAGGVKRGSTYHNDIAYGADFDLERILGIPGAQIHIVGDTRFGGIGSGFNPFNGSGIGYPVGAGPSNRTRLSELTYEQAFFEDKLEIRLGRLSSTYYLTNAYANCQFVSFTCGNPAGWGFNNAQVFWPYATWGAQVTIRPTPTTYVRTGIYEDDARDVRKSGTPFDGSWDFKNADGAFIPVEAGYTTTFATDPYPRHYAIGFYLDTKNFADNRFNTLGQPIGIYGGTAAKTGARTEVYGEFNQTIWKPNVDSQRNVQLFGGAYFGTSGQPLIDSYFTLGAFRSGPFESRPNDQIAILGVLSNFNQSVVAAQTDRYFSATGMIKSFPRSTVGLEINYTAQLAPGVTLRPFADLIFNPDQQFQAVPKPDNKFSFGFGAQIRVNFNNSLGFNFIRPVH